MQLFVILLISAIKGITQIIKACSLLCWNIIAFAYNNYIVKKTIQEVEQDNLINRDVWISHIAIDQFFLNGFYYNTFISGGDRALRTELLYAGIIKSSVPSLIIHSSNVLLCDWLLNTNTVIISNRSYNYDPFYLRSDDEIVDLIIGSVPLKYHLEDNASEYIQGMLMFLHSKNIKPTLHRLASCPHSELISNINLRVKNGTIDQDLARSITMKLNAGQSERYKIDRYLRNLEGECRNLLINPQYGNCHDIKEAIESGKNIIIDMGGTYCPLFINMICFQIQDIKRCADINVIIEDVAINTADNTVRELIEKTTQGLIISSEDLNALFQNNEDLFSTYYSNCYSRIILRHNNGESARRLSNYIGSYKKKVIRETIPETVFQLSTPIPIGVPIHHIIEEKDEPKISGNEMQKMGNNKAYHYNYMIGKWQDLTLERS